MGWHIHHVSGEFNVWSTTTDAYLLTEWVDEETIIEAFKEDAVRWAVINAKRQIERAVEKGCSALYPVWHSPEEIMELKE